MDAALMERHRLKAKSSRGVVRFLANIVICQKSLPSAMKTTLSTGSLTWITVAAPGSGFQIVAKRMLAMATGP